MYVISNRIRGFFRREITLILLIGSVFFGTAANSYSAERPTAFSRSVQPIEFVERVVPEPIVLQSIRLEDELREQQGGPYRFAIPRTVFITPDANGMWEQIDNETLLWRIHIVSPGAASLSLGFTTYNMPPGGRLFVYSADGKQVLGPYTEHDNAEHHQLWTPLIHSDDIVAELTVPVDDVADLELALGSINHGYRRMLPSVSMDKGLGDSDWCEVDVNCPSGDGWRDQIRSVARYHVTLADGTYVCTGALINNVVQDDKPYFLTAFHCFDEYNDGVLANPSGAAASMVVYWNFQASTCGGTTGPEDQTQTGAYFRAAYISSDFLLAELDEMSSPSYGVYYAGWDRGSSAPTSGVAIHHPAGDLKKISIENQSLSVTSYGGYSSPGNGTHLRLVDWDSGTTEGGSSGCPVFNQDKRIAGQLHGGLAACSNNESDWFGRYYTSWTGGGTSSSRLSDWLDPLGTGALTLDGKNPGELCETTKTTEYHSTDVPKTILSSATHTSTLFISDSETIIDVNITLDITHTYDSDLDVFLIAPDSTRVELFTDVGVDGDNFTNTVLDDEASTAITSGSAPFTGSYRPEGNLSDFYSREINGTWTLEVTDDAPGDTGTLNSWSLVIETCYECETVEDFETGDFSGFPWVHSGDADWLITSLEQNSGSYSAHSGDVDDSQSSSLEVTLECVSGNIEFYRKVSSELGYDYLKFYIDGVLKDSWSGSQSWSQLSYPVLAGTRIFKWTYSKDGSVSSGSDTAWIDDIAFPWCGYTGDLEDNGRVDFIDFSILASQWLQSPGSPSADIAPVGGDGIVNGFDLKAMVDNWLAGVQ